MSRLEIRSCFPFDPFGENIFIEDVLTCDIGTDIIQISQLEPDRERETVRNRYIRVGSRDTMGIFRTVLVWCVVGEQPAYTDLIE
jgi:hypothetical protein